MGYGIEAEHRRLTSLIIQLLQDLSDDLTDTLNSLEILLRLVVRFLLITDVQTNCSNPRLINKAILA